MFGIVFKVSDEAIYFILGWSAVSFLAAAYQSKAAQNYAGKVNFFFGNINAVYGAGVSDDGMAIANIGGKCCGACSVLGAAWANSIMRSRVICSRGSLPSCLRKVSKNMLWNGEGACGLLSYPQYVNQLNHGSGMACYLWADLLAPRNRRGALLA